MHTGIRSNWIISNITSDKQQMKRTHTHTHRAHLLSSSYCRLSSETNHFQTFAQIPENCYSSSDNRTLLSFPSSLLSLSLTLSCFLVIYLFIAFRCVCRVGFHPFCCFIFVVVGWLVLFVVWYFICSSIYFMCRSFFVVRWLIKRNYFDKQRKNTQIHTFSCFLSF